MNRNIKRLLILNAPYFLIGLYATKLGQAYRLAAGSGFSDKLLHLMEGFTEAVQAMFIYQNFPVKLTLSKDMDKELKELQKQFMPEDTKAGLIQSFLDNYKGTQVCSKLIYAEALNHPFDEPKQWEIREINEIMNNCIEGWRAFSNPRSFAKYGRQRGWERIPPPDNEPSATGSNLTDGFHELTEEEARQMELPF